MTKQLKEAIALACELLCTALQLLKSALQQRRNQRPTVREVAVQRRPAHTRAGGHQLQRHMHALLRENLVGCVQQQGAVGLRIGA